MSDNAPDDRKQRAFRLETGAGRLQRDVDEEMAFHLAMRAQKLETQGLSSDDARQQALMQFGDVTSVRTECVTIDQEHYRNMNRANGLQNLRQDIAYAIRSLRHNKGFALVTVLILALGIGANTAIFSLVDVLILRALSVPHANELVTIGDPTRTGSMSQGSARTDIMSYPLYNDIRNGTRSLSGVYASGRTGRIDLLVKSQGGVAGAVTDAASTGTAATNAVSATGATQTAPIVAASAAAPDHPAARLVSGNYFAVLQVPAFAGRTFAASEGITPGDAPVTVLSYSYWQRRFGGDRSAIGRVVLVNGSPFTIIGVAAETFTGDIVDRGNDLWLPLSMQQSVVPNVNWLDSRSINWLQVMGRRAPGVSIEQARTELADLMRRSLMAGATAAEVPGIESELRKRPIRVENGAQGFSFYRSQYGKSLYTLMAAVALVLLVVCANVANLLLARATARARELSVRMALGASRVRLVQQLLTESLLIAVAGGALGVLVANWASQALLQLANGRRNGIALDTHADARILVFSALLSLGTAALFGLLPALRATRVELATALRSGGRNVSSGGGKFSTGRMLVVAQVAVSVLLLVGTGMLVRSMQRLERADIGASRGQLIIASFDAEKAGYSDARLTALMNTITSRVRQIPGVADAAVSENGIFSGTESTTAFNLQGFTAREESDTTAAYDDVGARYFHTIGARILQGRDFEDRDSETGRPVSIINETMAKYFFPNGDALGHRITMGSTPYEIVGVVSDVNGRSLRGEPTRRFYVPMAQYATPPGMFYLQVRTTGQPTAVVAALREFSRTSALGLPLRGLDVLDDLVRDSIGQDRLVAQVVTLFGVLTLLLSALGLYGVMAYATVRRTSEFGLRLALGAGPGSIVRMVLRDALAMTGVGLVIGMPLAFGMSQLLREQLFGVKTIDVPSISLAVVVLAISAAAAAYVPAMRASRVAPLDALRSD